MRPLVLVCIVGGLCLTAACASEQPAQRTAEQAALPIDLLIVAGQTAGLAGRMRGYSVRADGRVRRWEGKYIEENVLAESTAAPEVVDSLWRRVQDSDFFSQSQQVREEGAFLSVTADGDSRRVSWTAVPSDTSDAALAQLYVSVQQHARDALRPEAPGQQGAQ